MGNASSRAQPPSQHLDSASQLRTYLMDYSHPSANLVFVNLIGDGKFLKTIHAKSEGGGDVIVKVYRKTDPNEMLHTAEKKLRFLSAQLPMIMDQKQQLQFPNILPYADYQLSKKSNVAFLVRQYFVYNLYDRLNNTRPFVSEIEKKWLAFQLLKALEQCHSKGVIHGDIKPENVMLTSWNWIFLTDFAPFKPTMIPEDDPSEYYYYFRTLDSNRKSCYIAPERFYSTSSANPNASTNIESSNSSSSSSSNVKGTEDAILLSNLSDSRVTADEVDQEAIENVSSSTSNVADRRRIHPLQESMDIFSVGCTIGEIFLGGKSLFDLPTLLKYRTGHLDLEMELKKIACPQVVALVRHMLQIDPRLRCSAAQYRKEFSGVGQLFPAYFDNFLFKFMNLSLTRGNKVPDGRIRLVCKYYARILKELANMEDPDGVAYFEHRLTEGYGSEKQWPKGNLAQRVFEEMAEYHLHKSSSNKIKRKLSSEIKDQSSSTTSSSDSKGHHVLNVKNFDKLSSIQNISEKNIKKCNGTVHDDDNCRRKSSVKPLRNCDEGNGVVIICDLICSTLRHVRVPQTKLTAIELLTRLSLFTTDEVRLERLLPFVIEVLSDGSACVRVAGIRSITSLTAMITSFPSSDASIFPQYILPALNKFPADPEEIVRIAFAECLPRLAETSRRFLDISFAMKIHQHSKAASSYSIFSHSSSEQTSDKKRHRTKGKEIVSTSCGSAKSLSGFDKELYRLHQMISRFVIQIAAPDQRQSSSLVKRALLHDISRLCIFFGRERTLDVVLPQLITVLNSRDWELRSAFFQHITGVCSFVGRVSLEMYILPCIEQALIDTEELVIARALCCLATLCQLGLFQRHALMEKVKTTAPLLFHPSCWVREAVIELIVAIANDLGTIDMHAFLLPILRPFLVNMQLLISKKEERLTIETLRKSLRSPVSRESFDAALISLETPSQYEQQCIPPPPASNLVSPTSTASGNGGGGRDSFISVSSSVHKNDFNTVPPPPLTIDSRSISVESTHEELQTPKSSSATRTVSNSLAAQEELEKLSLMQKYVSIASSHMRHKLQLATSEHSARLGSSSTLPSYAKKLSRSYLYTIRIPDMRFALLQGPVLKPSTFYLSSSNSSSTSSSRKRRGSSPSVMQETTTSDFTNSSSGLVSSVIASGKWENLSLSVLSHLHGLQLIGRNQQYKQSGFGVTGTSQPPQTASYMDTTIFMPTTNSKPSTNTSNNSSKNNSSVANVALSVVDPAFYDTQKLRSRLYALDTPPMPPDMGCLATREGFPFSVYQTPGYIYGGPRENLFNSHHTSGSSPKNGSDGTNLGGVGGPSTAPPSGSGLYDGNVTNSLSSGGGGLLSPPDEMGNSPSINGSNSNTVINAASSSYFYGTESYYRSWKPKEGSILYGELLEHSDSVCSLDVPQDFSFVCSGSYDGTVKIWSASKLMEQVNHSSQYTYNLPVMGSRVTDVKIAENSHAVVIGSSQGLVQVVKIDSGQSSTTATHLKTLLTTNKVPILAVEHMNNVTESLVIYATQTGAIFGWDLRFRRQAWLLQMPLELGYISCMTHSPDSMWLAVGTSRGFVAIWDIRYSLLIRVWRHSSHVRIETISPCLGLPPMTSSIGFVYPSLPLLYIAAADNIAVWDISIGACRAVFQTLSPHHDNKINCPVLEHYPLSNRKADHLASIVGPKAYKEALHELQVPSNIQGAVGSVRTLLSPSLYFRGLTDSLITAGEDCHIRYWNLRQPKKSFTISGGGGVGVKSFYDSQEAPPDWWKHPTSQFSNDGSVSSSNGKKVKISKAEQMWSKLSAPLMYLCQDYSNSLVKDGSGGSGGIASERRGPIPPSPDHKDCILALKMIELKEPMILSSGRDGVIKIWR